MSTKRKRPSRPRSKPQPAAEVDAVTAAEAQAAVDAVVDEETTGVPEVDLRPEDALKEKIKKTAAEAKIEKRIERLFDAADSRERIIQKMEEVVAAAYEERDRAKAAGRSYRVYHMVGVRIANIREQLKRIMR